MPSKLDLTGHVYSRLTVIEPAERVRNKTAWLCRCECGRECIAITDALRAGTKKSCGCWYEETRRFTRRTHGRSSSRTFRIWAGMLQRCSNPNVKCYERYGGRGILVCDRWLSFENFLADMGEAPEGMTIDREDNDGNYEPGNCRWQSRQRQSWNTRRSILVEYEGQRVPLQEAAKLAGISPGIAYYRKQRGYPEHLWLHKGRLRP